MSEKHGLFKYIQKQAMLSYLMSIIYVISHLKQTSMNLSKNKNN